MAPRRGFRFEPPQPGDDAGAAKADAGDEGSKIPEPGVENASIVSAAGREDEGDGEVSRSTEPMTLVLVAIEDDTVVAEDAEGRQYRFKGLSWPEAKIVDRDESRDGDVTTATTWTSPKWGLDGGTEAQAEDRIAIPFEAAESTFGKLLETEVEILSQAQRYAEAEPLHVLSQRLTEMKAALPAALAVVGIDRDLHRAMLVMKAIL